MAGPSVVVDADDNKHHHQTQTDPIELPYVQICQRSRLLPVRRAVNQCYSNTAGK